MPTRFLSVVAALVVAALFAGCPSRPLGSAPKRAVLPSDAVGAWRYAALPAATNQRGWIFTLELSADGAFRQTLVSPQARNVVRETGTWRIETGALRLEKLIVWDEKAPSHWSRRDQVWQVAESRKHPGALALIGGLAADHSLDDELEKVSAAECRLLTSVTP